MGLLDAMLEKGRAEGEARGIAKGSKGSMMRALAYQSRMVEIRRSGSSR